MPPDEALCALCKEPYRVGMSAVCYRCGHAHGSPLAEPALRDEVALAERKLTMMVVGSLALTGTSLWVWLDDTPLPAWLEWVELVHWWFSPSLITVLTLLSANEWRRYRALKRSGR